MAKDGVVYLVKRFGEIKVDHITICSTFHYVKDVFIMREKLSQAWPAATKDMLILVEEQIWFQIINHMFLDDPFQSFGNVTG